MLKKIIFNPFFFFLTTTIVFFGSISFLLFSLKNDALTYYYPIRTLISDALLNGELPLWTPYINMGYPMHADMQSGAWNPIIWIFSFVTQYSLAGFHYELIFYVTFAGVGFYYLCKELGCSKYVALTAAVAYQFSGFMIDSVQFFTCISSACYLPFVLLFFRRIMLKHHLKDSLILSLFLFLFFTGGYPSLFIITCYTFLAYALFLIFNSTEKLIFLKKITLPLCLVCLCFLLLSLPAIISFVQHLPSIERGKGQTLETVLENSMNPSTALSLLSPFGTTANNNWLSSSILMRSIYIGILPLIFFVLAFFNKTFTKNRENVFFLIYGLVMLGLAFGKFFFFRQIAFYTLPLFNSFRHAGLFRLFSIFFFLLIAAKSLEVWSKTEVKNNNSLKKIIVAIGVIASLIGAVCLLYFGENNTSFDFNIAHLKEYVSNSNFQRKFLFQFLFLIATLLLSYIVIIKKKSVKLVLLVTLIDLFFATQLNIPITVIASKKYAEVESLIARNKTAFPIPSNASIAENAVGSYDENFIAGSKIPFSKKVGRNEYYITPGNLIKQDKFYASSIKDVVFKNSLLYFADTNIVSDKAKTDTIPKIAFIENEKDFFVINKPAKTDSFNIEEFSANKIVIKVSKKDEGLLVYLQNNYNGWKAYIDDKEVSIIPVNITFMAIKIPSGDYTVTFKYQPRLVIYTWYISIVSLVAILLYFLLAFSKQKSMKSQMENA